MNGNYSNPYQAPAGQAPMQQPAQYQAPQQMPAQQPMMEQPQQQMPTQQPMMGQPPQQMPPQQPMMDQPPQQMPGQQPMMEQSPQQMPDQQLSAQQPDEDLRTGTEEKGKTWLLVTILAGLGIFVMIISLLVLFLTDATTEVDVPSIVVTVSAVFGLVCLACAMLLNSGKFSISKVVPGATGILSGLAGFGAIGMGFSDLSFTAYILIVGALVLLVGGILSFLAKPPEEAPASTETAAPSPDFSAQQPMEQQQQMPPAQQPMEQQQQMPPAQQFPGQPQQMPPAQQLPPAQQMPMQQQPMQQGAPPGGAFPQQGGYPPF